MWRMVEKEKNKNSDSLTPPTIDKVIHELVRLLIVSILFVVESADFLFLKNQTGLTWGNLSSHITKLEDAGYVNVKKEFVKKKTRTLLSLTDAGKEAFRQYKRNIEEIEEYARKISKAESK
ncbi:MAG: winged helix-turn-helix domain-containing protein [Promethearchaeota archaeon]